MRSIRRPVLAAAALTAVMALTATGCGPEGDNADANPSQSAAQDTTGGGDFKIPQEIQDKLKEHGVDLDKWKNGEWKNWDRDKWLREAGEFINPIIKDFWDKDKIDKVKPPQDPSKPEDISEDQGKTDPEAGRRPGSGRQDPVHLHRPRRGPAAVQHPEGRVALLRHRRQGPGAPR